MFVGVCVCNSAAGVSVQQNKFCLLRVPLSQGTQSLDCSLGRERLLEVSEKLELEHIKVHIFY